MNKYFALMLLLSLGSPGIVASDNKGHAIPYEKEMKKNKKKKKSKKKSKKKKSKKQQAMEMEEETMNVVSEGDPMPMSMPMQEEYMEPEMPEVFETEEVQMDVYRK